MAHSGEGDVAEIARHLDGVARDAPRIPGWLVGAAGRLLACSARQCRLALFWERCPGGAVRVPLSQGTQTTYPVPNEWRCTTYPGSFKQIMNFWPKVFKRPATPVVVSPEAASPMPSEAAIQLRDAILRGWFNNANGELFTGFPIGSADVVADIGCGLGGNARFCASRGAKLILADVDPACLEASSKAIESVADYVPYERHLTNSDPLPIANESCTKIICTEVIEHVESPERLMAELFRIGRPGAQYLLTCPDPSAEALQKRVAPETYFSKPNHVRILDRDEFARLAEAAGLIVESKHFFGFFWSIWWSFFWACDVSLERPKHVLLENWTQTWGALMELPDGLRIKNALDDLMPKSQMLIARKP